MSNFNLNISSKQIEQLRSAFQSSGANELDSSKFTGNINSIFDSLNKEYNNSFKNTGMEDILKNIAGDDEEISEEEIKRFMDTDGEALLSSEDFISYADNAINEAIKEFDLDGNKNISIKNNESGDVKLQVAQTDNVGNKEKLYQIKDDGTRYEFTYNDDGTKKTQVSKNPDGSVTSTEFIYDENGNKIGSKSNKYDENGKLQSVTERKYDEQGRKIYGKTVDAEGNLRGEANYKYRENSDGTTSQMRYKMDGELTETLVYKDNIKEPISKTNHADNTKEIFTKNESGLMTSTVQTFGGKLLENNEYDTDGKVTYKEIFNDKGEKTAEVRYTYYDNGELKSEDKKEFEVESQNEVEQPQVSQGVDNEPLARLNPDLLFNDNKNTQLNENSLGLTGEELVAYAKAMLEEYGSSVDSCATGVSRTFKMAYGLDLHGNGCDWTANMDKLVSQGAFKEVTCDYPSSSDLPKLPAGAVVTWDRTGADTPAGKYGHVAIADGNGGEISDNYRENIYQTVGGRKDTYHVYIPV